MTTSITPIAVTAAKVAIILTGPNRYTAQSPVGNFLPNNKFDELLWKGKLFDLNEANDEFAEVFEKKPYPPAYTPTVRIVLPKEAEEPEPLKGCHTLPAELETVGANFIKVDDLLPHALDIYGATVKDWNSLRDRDRANFIKKALIAYENGEIEVETVDEPSVENDPVSDPDTEQNDNGPSKPPVPLPTPETDGVSQDPTTPLPDVTSDGEVKKEDDSNEFDTETKVAESKETEDESKDEEAKPVRYEHRGRGKYDVYDKHDNVVLDNVTKAEAKAAVGEE